MLSYSQQYLNSNFENYKERVFKSRLEEEERNLKAYKNFIKRKKAQQKRKEIYLYIKSFLGV